MSVPIMNSCCFCISPRAGLLTFIYLKLTLQAFIVLLITAIKVASDDFVKENNDFTNDGVSIFIFKVVPNIAFYLILIIILIKLPFEISGLVGAHKESLSWLNVYYYFSLTCVLLNVIGVVHQAVEGSYQIAIWVVIYIAINTYMLFVAKAEKTRLESEIVNNPNKFGLPPSKGSPIKSGYAYV